MELREIMLFPKAFIFVFEKIPFEQKIYLVSCFTGLAVGIYVGIISPVIFNYYLIPGIEKKIGRKLIPHPMLSYIVFGKWMWHQNEIAVYLINRYYALKFKGDRGLPQFCNRFDLKKAGYTICMASRTEIFFSFLWLFSIAVVCVSGAVVLIMSNYVSLH